MTDIVYLACPYTHPNPNVRQRRFDIINEIAADLIQAGYVIYSPIGATHLISIIIGRTSSEYWAKFDEAFMAVCSRMIVVKMDGWENSVGLKREIEYFQQHNKPIQYMEG